MSDAESRPPVAKSLAGILIATGLGAALASAGSSGSLPVSGLPAFAIAAALAFAIQWIAFIPAYLAQSERFYDLIGSLTYLSVELFAYSVKADERSMLLVILIGVWAVRLGSFLDIHIEFDHVQEEL